MQDRICQRLVKAQFSKFWFLLLAGFLVLPAFPAEKRILLRNETIVTSGLKRQALASDKAPATGLFLLQLTEAPPQDWKTQLAAKNVHLLRPVPQDAYVVHLRSVSPAAIGELPFVQFLGPYKAVHKTHPAIAAAGDGVGNQEASVKVLLSPDADAGETMRLRRQFSKLAQHSENRFGSVLEGTLSSDALRQVILSDAVLWIEPAPEPQLFDAVAGQIVLGAGSGSEPAVHALGFDGSGVTVAVADSGLQFGEVEGMHPDLFGRVEAFFQYGALDSAADEHGHGTHIAGIIAGNGSTGETDEHGVLYGLGIAPKSRIVAQRLFDGLGGYEPPAAWAELTQDAVRAGATVGVNSWGEDTQGRYDINAMQFDALVRDADPETPGDQAYVMAFSAGNAGPGEQTIGSPAVAKNVIATGASQNDRFDFADYAKGREYMADLSSRGPAEDGRIKPDLAAPGTWIASLKSAAASDENAWLPISDNYMYQGGTSQAAAQVAGAAAVFIQYYRETHSGATPSPALVKAALINSATDMDNSVPLGMDGTRYTPNDQEGWGRVNLATLIASQRSHDFTDQTELLTTGQFFEKRFYIASYHEPLKVTLAYTDVPGFPPAIPALVNDLDLEVVAPDGSVYRGNHFLDGQSVEYLAAPDSINNVEGVHIRVPDPGEYIIRVRARNVVEDARDDTPEIDQDFALVLSGSVPMPGQGVLTLQKRCFTAPDEIEIKLIDFDLAGHPSASVSVKSTSHPTPLVINLQAVGSIGFFSGSVPTTASGGAGATLQVSHGDAIQVVYYDQSPAQQVTATAEADLRPAVISLVASTNHFGKEVVTWTTDEPARSTLFLGFNGEFTPLTRAGQNTSHRFDLADLEAGQTYQFYVVSTDQAGNSSTNNNNGSYWSFIAVPAPTALVVDAYTYSEMEGRNDVEIPVSSYTDALSRSGITHDVWDVEIEGPPSLDDLKPYRVVIWRLNDSFWEPNQTISAAEQAVITQYLTTGGSFLLSSMDILTKLGNVPFRTNVLQVAEFTHRTGFSACPECQEDYTVPSIYGSELQSLTSGISLDLDYSDFPIYDEPPHPVIGPDLSDVFTPTTNAVPIIFEPGGQVTGIRYPRTGQDAPGRVVFLAFPLDAVPLEGPAPNNRANLLRNLISFLAPGVNGLGSISLDATTYTAPSRVTIEAADSDLIGRDSVSVVCRNRTSGAQTVVPLYPTPAPGLFRGFVTLTAEALPAASGRLQVSDGDLIAAEYMDTSANGLVRASAEIDLGYPTISSVVVQPHYSNAMISWETDEPADALIQFGESAFLGKTVYNAAPGVFHSLVLPLLMPDRTYYFQIVSRDDAGNTVIDDNEGELYSFRTLKPLAAPWSDDLENGPANWSVVNDAANASSWMLGEPSSFAVFQAHSPMNAWGVNLTGQDPAGPSATSLISPAVNLTGGNRATLKFWHAYDALATSQWEKRLLQLHTNSQTQPLILAEYDQSTVGWVEEEIDLTPYLGNQVQVVWAYRSTLPPGGSDTGGWFLDDVELVVSTVTHGVLQVTNNLSEASFTVTGPSDGGSTGRWFENIEAIAGEYIVEWQPVPYYTTPEPQTNVLVTSGSLRFTGSYTFGDANENQIPDAWEIDYFGEVSPDRSSLTDTDGDGLTDRGEFVAGTHPFDPWSALSVEGVQVQPSGEVQITWRSIPGKTYRVMRSSDSAAWTPASETVRAPGELASQLLPASGSMAFYKVEVVP